MAHSVTMGNLVTRAKRRANKEGNDAIASTEWKANLSEAYGELQSIAIDSGMRYFESQQTITADGSSSYNLPSDYARTIEIDFLVNSAGTLRPLRPLTVQERAIRAGQVGEAIWYELQGTTIVLYPKPSTGTYYHLYVPQPTDISAYADGTSVDTLCLYGEQFLINYAAAIAHAELETDGSFVMAERDKARQRFMEWAAERFMNEPKRPMTIDEDTYDWQLDPGNWWYGR